MLRLVALSVMVSVATYAVPAWASKVSVSPVRIHLSASKRSELLELRNSGNEAARYQIIPHVWDQSESGEMKLTPTTDLLVFPSLLEVKPGETRRVRIATSVAAGAAERSYRIIAQELPSKSAGADTVKVLTNLNLPVFVQPRMPKPRPAVTAIASAGRLSISLHNTGTAYFNAQSVRVVARSSAGTVLFEKTFSGWYVLAGGRRVYTVEVSKSKCAELASISTAAVTNHGTATSVVAVRPGAACAE